MQFLITFLELTFIFLPIIVALIIVFLIYIFGNVYNGLVRRREKVKVSWYELKKVIVKSYSLLPDIVKHLEDEKIKEELRDFFGQYKALDLDRDIEALAELDSKINRTLKSLVRPNGELDLGDNEDFAKEYRRIMRFSIPLYNANVRNYNHFRKLFVNRLMARIFKFDRAQYFLPAAEIESLKRSKQ